MRGGKCGGPGGVKRAERCEGPALEARRGVLALRHRRVAALAEVRQQVHAGGGLRNEQRKQRQQDDRAFGTSVQRRYPGRSPYVSGVAW